MHRAAHAQLAMATDLADHAQSVMVIDHAAHGQSVTVIVHAAHVQSVMAIVHAVLVQSVMVIVHAVPETRMQSLVTVPSATPAGLAKDVAAAALVARPEMARLAAVVLGIEVADVATRLRRAVVAEAHHGMAKRDAADRAKAVVLVAVVLPESGVVIEPVDLAAHPAPTPCLIAWIVTTMAR
ncbi:hypothetical protein [Aeoliella sp.]|uniref:hypothetical protein n=1 Tax=Aeoliella sp. TaxID=2795800 RepID=UPI003CCC1D2D